MTNGPMPMITQRRTIRRAAVKVLPHVNDRAKAAHDEPRFLVRIREGLPRMAPDRGKIGVTP